VKPGQRVLEGKSFSIWGKKWVVMLKGEMTVASEKTTGEKKGMELLAKHPDSTHDLGEGQNRREAWR